METHMKYASEMFASLMIFISIVASLLICVRKERKQSKPRVYSAAEGENTDVDVERELQRQSSSEPLYAVPREVNPADFPSRQLQTSVQNGLGPLPHLPPVSSNGLPTAVSCRQSLGSNLYASVDGGSQTPSTDPGYVRVRSENTYEQVRESTSMTTDEFVPPIPSRNYDPVLPRSGRFSSIDVPQAPVPATRQMNRHTIAEDLARISNHPYTRVTARESLASVRARQRADQATNLLQQQLAASSPATNSQQPQNSDFQPVESQQQQTNNTNREEVLPSSQVNHQIPPPPNPPPRTPPLQTSPPRTPPPRACAAPRAGEVRDLVPVPRGRSAHIYAQVRRRPHTTFGSYRPARDDSTIPPVPPKVRPLSLDGDGLYARLDSQAARAPLARVESDELPEPVYSSEPDLRSDRLYSKPEVRVDHVYSEVKRPSRAQTLNRPVPAVRPLPRFTRDIDSDSEDHGYSSIQRMSQALADTPSARSDAASGTRDRCQPEDRAPQESAHNTSTTRPPPGVRESLAPASRAPEVASVAASLADPGYQSVDEILGSNSTLRSREQNGSPSTLRSNRSGRSAESPAQGGNNRQRPARTPSGRRPAVLKITSV